MLPVIVALDCATQEEAVLIAKQLDPKLCRLKVASTLFTHYGPAIVTQLQALGFDIFLDLKYHDIPEQVASACAQAAALGVWMLTVHCSGGEAMMMAARKALNAVAGRKPLLVGVTVLTSLSTEDLSHMGYAENLIDTVLMLAKMAQHSGLDGVVCSAAEASVLRKTIGDDFLLVTPGIRFEGDDVGDQKRVVTPHMALASGSSYLVIGRPITQARDPATKLKNVINLI